MKQLTKSECRMSSGRVAGYTERAKQRFVRLTRRFGGVMPTVMVPTDYPVQPGDTIYVLERIF